MSNPIYIQKIELSTLAALKTIGGGVQSNDSTIYYYYKINKKFGFVDSNGNALAANDTVTLYYYRVPLSDGSETISDEIEPIIDSRWDDYLVFRTCFELTGDLKYLGMAEAELKRTRTLQLAEQDRTYTIPVNRDYD